MQILDLPPQSRAALPHLELPPGIPSGSQLQHIALVADEQMAGTLLMEFSQPTRCRALLLPASAADSPPPALGMLSLLWMPCSEIDPTAQVEAAWNWVEPGVAVDQRQGQLITLHGARIVWMPGRAALIAPEERLPQLRLAMVEFTLYETEVRRIEQALAALWPEMEQDGTYAFGFDERGAAQRQRLAQRFQELLTHRTRLVRLASSLHRPPVHPPTLASQLTERLKERSRLVERAEVLGDQMDVFERVYDMCAQRSSDYALSRKETTLEWIIIVLLSAELIVLLVDMLSTVGT